jgi:hypothetical protein
MALPLSLAVDVVAPPLLVRSRTTANALAVPCSTRTSLYGTLTVCPDAAPAGATVTVSGKGCRGAALAFLGPLDYIGSGGGGALLPGRIHDNQAGGFEVRFEVPPSYLTGGSVDVPLAVVADSQYSFGSYPANRCSVPFRVTGPPGTAVALYRPFTTSGATPGLHFTAHFSGTCRQRPGGTGDQTYYRCFTTTVKTKSGTSVSYVFDPCFASPGKTARHPVGMVCPTDPVNGEAVALEATAISGSGPFSLVVLQPWAFQLASGQVCQLVAAAWAGLGPYACGLALSGATKVADCHVPDHAARYWTTQCQAKASSIGIPFKPAVLKRAWF